MRGVVHAACLVMVGFTCTGCATLFAWPVQKITVTSSAPGATVLVDGEAVGVTPLKKYVSRRRAHMVVVKNQDGSEMSQALNPKLGAMFWIDLLTFYFLIIDLPLGSVYTLEPAMVHSTMVGAGATGPPRPPPIVGKMANIAVADLEPQGVSGTDAAVLSDVLRNRLVNIAGFNVVEKKNMNKVLSEQAFQQTGCTSAECAVKLGKVLNVQGIIVGSFGKLLGRYVMSARLVDVESGAVVLADEAKGDTVDGLQADVDKMVARIGRAAR